MEVLIVTVVLSLAAYYFYRRDGFGAGLFVAMFLGVGGGVTFLASGLVFAGLLSCLVIGLIHAVKKQNVKKIRGRQKKPF